LEPNERLMAPLFRDGLEIVRYSPKERNIPGYAGESAVIRFAKDPADWYGWTGEDAHVANLTQHLAQRGDACGYPFWREATKGLPVAPAGPGSEAIGGLGSLSYDEMRAYLRRSRVYLYTGTQPASYTLGLIEAMMTGVPVVSIGPRAFGGGSYLSDMFEGHEITGSGFDDPSLARDELALLMEEPQTFASAVTRERAIDLFGIDTISAQWASFLGKGG
jgi:glycosyltransferase involved in cell wall biosynthesis